MAILHLYTITPWVCVHPISNSAHLTYPLNPIDLIILVCCIPSLKPWSLILPTLDLPP